MAADDLAAFVGIAAAHEFALERIKHCLGQLNDDLVWRRSKPSLNSIGNLILHLCGNVRQWIVTGLTGAPDIRNRPEEFAERGPIPKEDLLTKLEAIIEEAKGCLVSMPGNLLRSVASKALMLPGRRRSSPASHISAATRKKSFT